VTGNSASGVASGRIPCPVDALIPPSYVDDSPDLVARRPCGRFHGDPKEIWKAKAVVTSAATNGLAAVLEQHSRVLERVEARQQIGELHARYAANWDDHNIDAVMALFTETATLFHPRHDFVGKLAIREHYIERWREVGLTIHTPLFSYVDFADAEHASGVVGGNAQLSLSGVLVVAAHRYFDEYVRQDDKWYFQSRRAEFIYAVPADELRDALDQPLRLRWPGRDPVPAQLPVGR
jgi:hypothetical protein